MNKDIIGINEQLYDLEKEQIRAGHQLQELKKEITQLKQEKDQSKKKGDKDDLDKVYKEGYKNYLEQNYSKAIELLSELTVKFTENPLISNALYWQGESYYKLDKINKALYYYQLVYRYFPLSTKADYSLYKIGMIFYSGKDYSKALLVFNRIVKEYPGSDLYKAALIKIRQIKKNRRKR